MTNLMALSFGEDLEKWKAGAMDVHITTMENSVIPRWRYAQLVPVLVFLGVILERVVVNHAHKESHKDIYERDIVAKNKYVGTTVVCS